MLNWNYRMLVYIVLVSFIVLIVGNRIIMAGDKTDIITMAEELAKEEMLNIEEWSVIAREMNTEITTKKEFKRKVKALQHMYPAFHWNIVWDDRLWKAETSFDQVTDNVTEYIRIVTTEEHNRYITYIIYEVKGHGWEEQHFASLFTTFQTRINHIFQENPSVFSCIKGSVNDNMDTVLAAEMKSLLHLFNAKEIEGVQEENFISTSAYSTSFKQTLPNEEINMQLSLRQDRLGDKTSFVIGTPIITFEY